MTTDVDLMERASEATGLSDFGAHDDFRTGLRVLLAALAESPLPGELRESFVGAWAANLETRLRLVQLRKEHPEIAAEKIAGPVAVIGLPRTGTTALVDLLAQDPDARSPLQWETANLFPPADPNTWRDDPRIEQFQAGLDAMIGAIPTLGALHTFGSTLPDECNTFLALDFWSPNFTAQMALPAYTEWLRLGRLQHPYATHHWVLQHLQAHGPTGRWTIKSPFHAFAVAELLAEYPDAVLVQTHRDPIDLLPSMAGLYSTIRQQGNNDIARLDTGRELLSLWGTGLQRCLAARRDPAADARILDVSHRALTTDPFGVVRSVYERFDLPFPAEAQQAIKGWLKHPAQHISPVRFSLDDFGLNAADVADSFGDYRDRFGDLF
jgi:hypothetical protein